MKTLVLVVVLMVVASACGSGDGTDLDDRTVRVAVENARAPFNFIDDTGNSVGFDYDIWDEICDRIGCTVEFIEAAWPAIIEETRLGTHDVAANGFSIVDDGRDGFDVSDHYMIAVQKLMVRADEARFEDLAHFQEGDFILGTQFGTMNHELGTQLVGESRTHMFDRFELAARALVSGDIDAVIVDDIAGRNLQEANADEIRLLADDLESTSFVFIYPQGSDLVDPVNEAIAGMKEDGTMDDLITTWFIDFEA